MEERSPAESPVGCIPMKDSILDVVANNLRMERLEVSAVVEEFLLQLHRVLYECRGDILGERLPHELSPQAYYHLLGFVETFSEKYVWESGSASEYLLRLGQIPQWLPYRHQMEGWLPSTPKSEETGKSNQPRTAPQTEPDFQ